MLNPTPHVNWFLITPILDLLVIIHIGSLIAASTETEMKSRIEYLYTWCQIKFLCQVFQPRAVRKLNQNSLRNGSSDKFRFQYCKLAKEDKEELHGTKPTSLPPVEVFVPVTSDSLSYLSEVSPSSWWVLVSLFTADNPYKGLEVPRYIEFQENWHP